MEKEKAEDQIVYAAENGHVEKDQKRNRTARRYPDT